MDNYIVSSEGMSAGHPDKVADLISDSIVDACLGQDPGSRVACEAMVKGNTVVVAGEVSTRAALDVGRVVRGAVEAAGYRTAEDDPVFHADALNLVSLLTEQSPDIARGVDGAEQGAGDQGVMFGFACNETPELMPAPALYANRLMQELDARHASVPFLRPDGKCQVSVEYGGNGVPLRISTVVASVQHAPWADMSDVRECCMEAARAALPAGLLTPETRFLVNPTGRFVSGGPQADCGLTGRKLAADTYGGAARHGGGAFSGKDCSKVDRSAAYMCRWVARHVVEAGLANRCEVQVAYAIGVPDPVSVRIASDGDDALILRRVREVFSFRPADIERELGLRRPIFRSTVNYGHFGRPGLPWEMTDERRLRALQG